MSAGSPLRLAALLALAVALALLLHALRLPGAWLFGPLIASALFAVRGWLSVRLPRQAYVGAQAVIGTALGAGFSPATLRELPVHFLFFSFTVFFILATSLLNGWILFRRTRLDAVTAFLGTVPGGAGEMAAMSDSLGADTRLVVVMQYIRLLLVLGSLLLVAPLLGAHHSLAAGTGSPSPLTAADSPFTWPHFALLFGLSAIGYLAGTYTRIPAGTFLVPALLYVGCTFAGLAPGRWPYPLFAAAYLLMGFRIGGQFEASTLALVRAILLPVCGTTLLLLGGSWALAWGLTREMGLDGMSAYLAATPGGLDSVAVVAAELHGDTAIILAVHLVRLLSVLLFGPWLVRALAAWAQKKKKGTG